MDTRWVKIRSWHAASGIVSRAAMIQTLCGRWTFGELVGDLPAEKSCETCLRILARMQDAA